MTGTNVNTNDRASLLRLALRLDAIATGAVGLTAVVAASPLADPVGVSAALLVWTGAALIVYSVAVWYLASRPVINPVAAGAVVALNAVWVVDSILAVAAGWLGLTTLGVVIVLAQAAVVAVLADLQFLGIRRMRSA